jgi:glycosyltransferase involved in cell wall biosynthesis
MKVALVTQPYDGVLPPRQNSIGLILYHTALELARSAEVHVYMKAQPPGTELNGHAFQIEEVDTPIDDLLTSWAARHPRLAGRVGATRFADQYPQYVRRVAKRLSRKTADIVHTMNYWSWCRTLNSARRGHKVVLEMQAEWLSQMDPRAIGRQLEHADAVVTVSDHIARLFKQALPGYRGLVATAYNGVNVDIFRPAAEPGAESARERSILFVGRTSPEKGVHVLIEAFAKIAATYNDARLDLVGPRTTLPARHLVALSDDPVVRRLNAFYDGSVTTNYQTYLDGLVLKLGLKDKVRFHGSLPHHKLVEIFQRSYLVCNPSFSESFGISIVEGMACAKPVIGANIGGMQETIVHGATGFHVEPDEPEQLAAAASQIFGDTTLARRMGARGRERAVAQFTWEARARRLLDLYKKVVER